MITTALILAILSTVSANNQKQVAEVKELSHYQGELQSPFLDVEGATFSPDGEWFVSDKLGYRIVHFNQNGEVTEHAGSRGTEPGQFIGPGPIAVHENTVAVADFASNRIQLFNDHLQYVRWFRLPGPIFDMQFDETGKLWTVGHSENVTAMIAAYDSTGAEITRFTPKGATGDLFSDVCRFCLGNNGLCYLAYHTQNLVEVWDRSGHFVRSFSIPGTPAASATHLMEAPWSSTPLRVPDENLIRDIAVDRTNHVYVLADGPTRHPLRDIHVFTAEGRYLGSFVLPQSATSIWFTPDGSLLAATDNRQTLRRFSISLLAH